MKENRLKVEGNIVDIHTREVYSGIIHIENDIISKIEKHNNSISSANSSNHSPNCIQDNLPYIMPGFIDAHVHIESSMQTPQHFGELIITQGTVAIVTDPHEIANVMGKDGIEFMLTNSSLSPAKIFFTIPSCVPATGFDLSGSKITAEDVEYLASTGKFTALSEMMNVPGVLYQDDEVMAKLATAQKYNLPIDGHSPLLTGRDLTTYINNGITTDHECTTLAEAQEKIQKGMKVIIREGSAAKNYETLKPLIEQHPNMVMFCTDDSHEYESIAGGHIKGIVKRSLQNGYNLFNILQIASANPINHYKLDVGQLRIGDKADFIVVDNLENLNIEQVYINGTLKFDFYNPLPDSISSNFNSISKIPENPLPTGITKEMVYTEINNFNHDKIGVEQLRRAVTGSIKVISLVPNELLTNSEEYTPTTSNNTTTHAGHSSCSVNFESDTANDILKIVYINRYTNGTPQIAWCKGFGLKEGALASSVSHDSHNIIAVGCSDKAIAEAVNAIIEDKGGISVCSNGKTDILPLPIGGIMSNLNGKEISEIYNRLGNIAKEMGCQIGAPFMTLSFMSLVVIPELKIGEHGLFSYSKFNWLES